MKKNLFIKVFIGCFLGAAVFIFITFFAGVQAVKKDPKLFGTLATKLFGPDFIVKWEEDSEFEERMDSWEFPPDISEISIDIVSGHLKILDSDKKKIEIFANGKIKKGNRYLLDIDNKNEIMDIRPPDKETSRDIDVTLLLPKSFHGRLKVETVSGEFWIEGGEFESIEASTISGNIFVKNAAAKKVDIESISGRVGVEGHQNGSIEISTLSGNTFIQLNDPKQANFLLESSSGKIRNPYPQKSTGGHEVKVDSISGDIEIR